MKQLKTANAANHEKELKDKNSWRMYDLEFQIKDKKDRKSVSNNKIISPSFLNNRLSKMNDNFSTEKNSSFNALGKAGSNIITNINKIPPHLKTNIKPNQEKINVKLVLNKPSNFTPKNNINYNFNDNKKVINYENVENINKNKRKIKNFTHEY